MKALAALAMLLAAHGALAAERTVEKEIVVNAPVEAVWKAWTTAEGLQSFFAPEAIVEPKPFGRLAVHFNPYAAPGFKGADDERVLAVQESRMISFTWTVPPYMPEIRGQHMSVVVRLRPEGEGKTHVTLVESGWGDGGEWDKGYDYFDKAWGRVLASLKARFETGPVDWTEHLAKMKAMTQQQKEKAGGKS